MSSERRISVHRKGSSKWNDLQIVMARTYSSSGIIGIFGGKCLLDLTYIENSSPHSAFLNMDRVYKSSALWTAVNRLSAVSKFCWQRQFFFSETNNGK
jgi:hypothetical protein